MSEHDHTARVPGCFRCELGQDELTGDCSEDCLERCAYPAQFSECATPDQPECGATCTGCSLCA